MAEVFLSFAPQDGAVAERLAKAIEALGLSVFRSGADAAAERAGDDTLQDTLDDALDDALDNAKAVVALWSEAARDAKLVRAEAQEAFKQDKLAPVALDGARTPVFFRGVQLQDFSDWSGETEAICFQRLAVQLLALVRGQDAAAALPVDGETSPEIAASAPPRPGIFRGAGSWLTLLAIIGLFLANLLDLDMLQTAASFLGSGWGAVLAFAAFAVALFQFAERDLTANSKALVARWLRSEPDAKPIKAARAFLTLFEAVFTKRHFSLTCFWRSAVASLLLYAGLLLALVDWTLIEQSATRLMAEGAAVSFQGGATEIFRARKLIELNAALLFLAVPLTNIVVDYFSLWQTRLILKLAAWRLPILLAVLFDAVLTGLVFILLLPLGPMLGIWAQGGFSAEAWGQALAFGPSIWEFALTLLQGRPWGEASSVLAGEAAVSATSLFIAFVTTFTTSVWLWLALAFAPLFRLLAWSRRELSVVGRLFNARRRPIASLGYVAAALILAVGGAAAGLSQTVRLSAGFQECAICPVMIDIPGGTFLMGSKEGDPAAQADEFPQREVTVKPFAIGAYEITFRQWDACVADGFCPCVDDKYCQQGRPRDEGWGRGLRPVINIGRADILGPNGFIAWLNSKVEGEPYRLPSEAEWEYAARAGTTTPYWTGETITAREANFRPDDDKGYVAQTLPVGGAANPFGLYDMHGNAYEWVADCWSPSYAGAPIDGSARGEPEGGPCREGVRRGGAWSSRGEFLRSPDRWGGAPARNDNFTFRVAREPRER